MVSANLSFLFLAGTVPVGLFVGVLVGAIVVIGAAGFFIGFLLHKKNTEKKIGEVNQRIKVMLDEAESESKALKKEAKKRTPCKRGLILSNSSRRTSSVRRARSKKCRKRSPISTT